VGTLLDNREIYLPEYRHLERDKGSNLVAWKIFELFYWCSKYCW